MCVCDVCGVCSGVWVVCMCVGGWSVCGCGCYVYDYCVCRGCLCVKCVCGVGCASLRVLSLIHI